MDTTDTELNITMGISFKNGAKRQCRRNLVGVLGFYSCSFTGPIPDSDAVSVFARFKATGDRGNDLLFESTNFGLVAPANQLYHVLLINGALTKLLEVKSVVGVRDRLCFNNLNSNTDYNIRVRLDDQEFFGSDGIKTSTG